MAHWLATARYFKITNERDVERLSPLNLGNWQQLASDAFETMNKRAAHFAGNI
jgi:hypothetical protein